MRRVDRDAFKRSIATVRAESAEESARVDEMLRTESWATVGETCAYACQDRALDLKPWQPPPCWIHDLDGTLADGDDGVMGRYAAALLLRQLLAAGLSRFEPDVLGAIERAEAARAAHA
jgi:hypothetical protein